MMESNALIKINCHKCKKDIAKDTYGIHLWFCSGGSNANPVNQNIFKSQIRMMRKLQDLKKNKIADSSEVFPCVHCSFPMTFAEFDTHPSKCPCLPIQCPYCKIEFPKDLMQEHDIYCQTKKDIAKNTPKKTQQVKYFPQKPTKPEDEPTTDQHVQFLMRQLAHKFGVAKPKALTNKQLVDIHKSFYKRNDKNQQGDICSICDIDFEEGQNLAKLPCGHRYHRRCICSWFSVANTCPMCRLQIQKKK